MSKYLYGIFLFFISCIMVNVSHISVAEEKNADFDLIICADISDSSDFDQTSKILNLVFDEILNEDRILAVEFAKEARVCLPDGNNSMRPKKLDKKEMERLKKWPNRISEIKDADKVAKNTRFYDYTDIKKQLMNNIRAVLEEFYKDYDENIYHRRRLLLIISDGVQDLGHPEDAGSLKPEDIYMRFCHDDVKLDMQIILIRTNFLEEDKSKLEKSNKFWEGDVKNWVEIIEAQDIINGGEIIPRSPRNVKLELSCKKKDDPTIVEMEFTREEPYLGVIELKYETTYENNIDLYFDRLGEPLRLFGDGLMIVLWSPLVIEGKGVNADLNAHIARRELQPKKGVVKAAFYIIGRDIYDIQNKELSVQLTGSSKKYNLDVSKERRNIQSSRNEPMNLIGPSVVFSWFSNTDLDFKLSEKNKSGKIILGNSTHELLKDNKPNPYKYHLKDMSERQKGRRIFKDTLLVQLLDTSPEQVKGYKKINIYFVYVNIWRMIGSVIVIFSLFIFTEIISVECHRLNMFKKWRSPLIFIISSFSLIVLYYVLFGSSKETYKLWAYCPILLSISFIFFNELKKIRWIFNENGDNSNSEYNEYNRIRKKTFYIQLPFFTPYSLIMELILTDKQLPNLSNTIWFYLDILLIFRVK